MKPIIRVVAGVVCLAIEWDLYQAYNDYDRGNPSPFSDFVKKGSTKWLDAVESFGVSSSYRLGDQEERFVLRLDNKTFGKSGAVTMKIAEGYTADLFIYSERNQYFTENTKITETVQAGALIKREALYDESIAVILNAGDYVSIDVDEEHSGIFRFRLVKDGQQLNIADPDEPNNEVFLGMIATYIGDQPEPPTPPIQPTPYPHSMFDCKTGTEYTANTEAEHDEYAALGYVHDLSECEIDSTGSSRLWGIALIGVIALGLFWLFTKSPKPSTKPAGSPPVEGGGGLE